MTTPRSELAPACADKFLDLVTRGARIGLWSADIATQLFECSGLDCTLFGLDPAAAPFHLNELLARLHPDDRDKTLEAWHAAASSTETFEHVYRLFRGEEMRWIHSVGKVQRDEAGHPVGFIGITMDITQQREAALALQEADRHKNEFLALLGHELRNRMAPIKMALQIQSHPKSSEQARAKAMAIAQRQVSNLDRLVDELLDIGRISTGHFELQWAHIDVAGFIADAIEMCRPLIQEKNQQLSISMPPDTLWIDGDKDCLARAVGNLLNNAIKYSGRRTTITLQVRDAGDHVKIAVQDEGTGIPPEKANRMFKLFTRGQEESSRSEAGLGVGLFVVKSVIDLHGGKISVTSAPDKPGAIFTMEIPKHAHEATPHRSDTGPHDAST